MDWSLLIFFSGLFIVTGALSYTGFSDLLLGVVGPWAQAGVPITLVTLGLGILALSF